MEKKFFDNEYLTITFDDEKSLLQASCKDKSKEFTDQQYMDVALTYAKYTEELKPRLILVDHTKFFYTITPSMQEWINNTILPKLFEAGVEKLAVVKSPYIFAEVAVEQILTHPNSKPIKHKLFKDKNEALAWLLGS